MDNSLRQQESGTQEPGGFFVSLQILMASCSGWQVLFG
jgi:hypothetical protein